jgi:formylglycine-generating enzyme required for sulfatase activity
MRFPRPVQREQASPRPLHLDAPRARRVLAIGTAGGLALAAVLVLAAHEPPQPPVAVPPLDLALIAVPARSFVMGSLDAAPSRHPDCDPRDEVPHRVTISRPFAITATEITRAQWLAVMRLTPWPESEEPAPQLPANHVSWRQAATFCFQLTRREREAGRLPNERVYRLPTEAEWELACRTGERRDLASPVGPSQLRECDRFGTDAPGLHDMRGNVWEWCADACHTDERSGKVRVQTSTYRDGVVDPLERDGEERIVRGGSYANSAPLLRPTNRFALPPDMQSPVVGFRVVLGAPLR